MRILADEKLAVVAEVLVVEKRAKVRVSFDVSASVVVGDGSSDEEDQESNGAGLTLHMSVEPSVKIVYGSLGDEGKMTEFVRKGLAASSEGDLDFDGWETVVRDLRERLIAGKTAGKGTPARK